MSYNFSPRALTPPSFRPAGTVHLLGDRELPLCPLPGQSPQRALWAHSQASLPSRVGLGRILPSQRHELPPFALMAPWDQPRGQSSPGQCGRENMRQESHARPRPCRRSSTLGPYHLRCPRVFSQFLCCVLRSSHLSFVPGAFLRLERTMQQPVLAATLLTSLLAFLSLHSLPTKPFSRSMASHCQLLPNPGLFRTRDTSGRQTEVLQGFSQLWMKPGHQKLLLPSPPVCLQRVTLGSYRPPSSAHRLRDLVPERLLRVKY